MSALSYYYQLAQFLLSMKSNVSQMTSSQEESQSVLASLDRIYYLVQTQIVDLQRVKD